MEAIDSELADKIRADILGGKYAESERLSEAQLGEVYNVSRTPVRLALRLLEREGLVTRGNGRGYRVKNLTVEDIMQAVQVKGHLESLAARLLATQPNREEVLPHMADAIDTTGDLLNLKDLSDPVLYQLQEANETFHRTILDSCGNNYVKHTCAQISQLPMLSIGTMVFDQAVNDIDEQVFRLLLGNAQHKVIYKAIKDGDPVRAESIMSEHSYAILEYIQTFVRGGDNLTVADLIAYTAGPLGQP